MSKNLTQKFHKNPKLLFLLDGVGALVSAFLLGFVLVSWENIFGIPPTTLYFLASFPIFFACFDLYCYNVKSKNSAALLKGIAYMNLGYCFLSISCAAYHYQSITSIGWTYIFVEITLIILLALLEIKTAKKR